MRRRDALHYVTLGTLSIGPNMKENKLRNQPENRQLLVFDSVTDLRSQALTPGALVLTAGYYQIDDGGGALYRIQEFKDLDADLRESETDLFEPLGNGLIASLLSLKSVSYRIFGAKGVAGEDDGPAIRKAHEYANRKGIPVTNLEGEFYIRDTRDIAIETDVDWGQTVFHIDESYHGKQPVFQVKSRNAGTHVLSNDLVQKILPQLKPGTLQIVELAPYKNHLIHLIDEVDRIGFREGPYSQAGRAKEELVYVEESGKLIGDIAWTFQETVTLEAIPLDSSFLTINGGSFRLSGANPTGQTSGYVSNGIYVSRSRTIIQNQWVGLEDGQPDNSMLAQSGFYYFSKVFNVQLENIRLIPREKDRAGEERDVPMGTYGIGGNRVLHLQLDNVTAEGDWLHWGVFGTNMMKDIYLSNCRLNRFDVHFHLWNLTVRDCHIGYKGISITGGGQLLIENTTVQQNALVNFRRDYGARWDGTISIRNCRQIVPGDTSCRILSFRAADYNYGYPIGLPTKIELQNILIDYTSYPAEHMDHEAWIIETSHFENPKVEQIFQFPDFIKIEDVFMEGRKKGFQLMDINNIESYRVQKAGNKGDKLICNSQLIVRNVPLADESIRIVSSKKETYDERQPHLKMTLENLDLLQLTLKGVVADISSRDCTIGAIQLGDKYLFQGRVFMQNCYLEPIKRKGISPIFQLTTEFGTTFMNCTVLMPLENGKADLYLLNDTGIFLLNKEVYFNHVQTQLGKDVRQQLKRANIPLEPEFMQRLLLNHES
ncbi:MAG: hypothetical protein KDC53_04030 [Saprospiraceae bacterium]|nr:hypothetical protein [Saprospiraceae bacterium]